jgi:hypothetical protein
MTIDSIILIILTTIMLCYISRKWFKLLIFLMDCCQINDSCETTFKFSNVFISKGLMYEFSEILSKMFT